MLIARCISALRGGAANQRGRSPRSDSERLPTSLTTLSPTSRARAALPQPAAAAGRGRAKPAIEARGSRRQRRKETSQLMKHRYATNMLFALSGKAFL